MTMIRLSRIHFPVTALGPGRRIGIWTQGCALACPGCMSRDTWAVDGGTEMSVDDVLARCGGIDPTSVTGVTISGGEPSEQPALTELVTAMQPWRAAYDWDILCYTGLELAEFTARCPDLPDLIDALVTGPFVAGEPTDLVWRGSANQVLIPLGERGEHRYRRHVTAAAQRPALQLDVDGEQVRLIGVPRRGDLARLKRLLAARGVRLEGTSWQP